MSNLAKIYSDVTGRTERAEARAEKVSQSPAEDAAKTQVRLNWLQSDVTQQLFKEVNDEILRLEQSADAIATSAEPSLILLVNLHARAKTLKELLKRYARPHS